ncbi:hypothetical protein JCM30237_24290 [Halolamina litorea]
MILAATPASEIEPLLTRLEGTHSRITARAAESASAAAELLYSCPPDLLFVPVEARDGRWRETVDVARDVGVDCVVVDTDQLLSPSTALEAGATEYIHTLDDQWLPLYTERFAGLLTRREPAGGTELPHTVGLAGLNEIDDVIYLFDADGRLRWWNEALSEVTGYTDPELAGMEPTDFFDGEDRDTISAAFSRALSGERVIVEAHLATKRGERLPHEFTATRLDREAWEQGYVCGVGRDIGERLTREAELRATERQMNAIFQDPLTFIGVLDRDGHLLTANRTALEYIDTTQGAVEGEPFWELPWWTESSTPQSVVEGAIERARRGESTRFEAEHRRSDGAVGTFDCVVRPVTDDDGEVVSVLAEAIEITEREQLRSELDEVLDRINDAMFALDTDWRITYVNDRALELTDSVKDDLLGSVFWEAFPEAIGTDYERYYRQAMETQQQVSFEAYFEPVDMWTGVRAYPSDTGLSIYYHDITEQRRAQQERELLATVTRIAAEATSFDDALEDVLKVVCAESEIVYGEAWVPNDGSLSPEATYYSGSVDATFRDVTAETRFERGEGLPGRVWERNEPEWIKDLADVPDSTFARREAVSSTDLRTAFAVPIAVDGEVVAVLAFFLGHSRDTDSRFIDSITTIAMDIGTVMARQRTRDELEQERQFQERLFDTSPVGIVVVGAEGELVRVNDPVSDVLGWAESEIASRSFAAEEWEITDAAGDAIPTAQLPVARVFRTGEPIIGAEHAIRQADGTRIWLRVNAAPLIDATGDVEHVIATVQDITEERAREHELQRQREQLSVMNRILRHDLRTHANVVLGQAGLLERGEVSVSDATAKIVDRMEGLLETAEKTRRSASLVKLTETAPRTVADLLADCERELSNRVASYTLEINADAPRSTLIDATDGVVLGLVELLENAVEHGDADSPVVVSTEHSTEESVVIRIRDHGPGIPRPELRVLRGEAETPLVHSSGTGIWLAKWLIEAHDGTLAIDAVENGGTVCTVTFPLSN